MQTERAQPPSCRDAVQAEISAGMYAVNEGVEWMILTNGQVWQAWHLTAGLPVVLDLALEVDLHGEGGPTQKTDALFPLSKEGFKHHVIDELWRVKAATSAKSIGTAITSDAVIEQIRKSLFENSWRGIACNTS